MNPDQHLIKLGQGLERLDNGAIRQGLAVLVGGTPGKLADTIMDYARDVNRFAKGHALFEMRHAMQGSRSYADKADEVFDPRLWDDDDDLADEYSDYLVDLAGVASDKLKERVGQALEDAHRDELGVNDSATALGKVLKGFGQGRLRTIVRTEGTRVSNKTRQDIAERAQELGFGPTHMRWSSILDDRVTHCCSFAHDHYRPLDFQDSRLVAPAHYSCRSHETFIFADDFGAYPSGRWIPWTEDQIERLEEIRSQEFPGWVS